MESKYIVAIVALSIFLIMFLIFFVLLARRRKTEAKLQAWLHEVYSDKNLIRLDYETSGGDEAVQSSERGIRYAEDLVSTEEKEPNDEVQLKIEEAFSKIESEGIEEITGNYNPQQ